MAERDDGSYAVPDGEQPASDAVLFRTTWVRTLVMMTVLAAGGWLVTRLFLGAVLGMDSAMAFVGEFLVTGAIFVGIFAGLSTWLNTRRPNWVRTSPAGIELASARRRAVFVPRHAVAAVRFRWVGPMIQLEVTTTSMAEATVSTEGWPPAIRRRSGRPTTSPKLVCSGQGRSSCGRN